MVGFLRSAVEAVLGKTASPERERFSNLVQFAGDVAALNPNGLIDIARLYLRPIQSELLLSCAENEPHGAGPGMDAERLFMPGSRLSLTGHWNYPRLEPDGYQVDLAVDPVLPWPWRRDKYAEAVALIGYGKKKGEWVQHINHRLIVLQPWGIAFVFGGNHSIASGILGGQGKLVPIEVYDMSALLAAVACDGSYYLEAETQKPICKMRDYRIGALFEIGRLMQKHKVTPLLKQVAGEFSD